MRLTNGHDWAAIASCIACCNLADWAAFASARARKTLRDGQNFSKFPQTHPFTLLYPNETFRNIWDWVQQDKLHPAVFDRKDPISPLALLVV